MGWVESEIGKDSREREKKMEFVILVMNKLPAIFEVNPDSRHQNHLVMM